MNQIKFILACSLLIQLISATHLYRRPILYSKLESKSDTPLSDRRDQSSTAKTGNKNQNNNQNKITHNQNNQNKVTSHENAAEPSAQPHNANVFIPGPPGLPLYTPFYLVPVRDQSHGSGNGGGFGAYGTLAIPGLHVNLGGGSGFGGSLSASGGFSGGHGGHYGAIGGAHAGGYGVPVHYGVPHHYGYPAHHYGGVGGVGGLAYAGITPFYAGSHGIHHKTDPTSSEAVNLNPTGPILGVTSQKVNDLEKQPEVLVEISPYQEEGFEQSVLLPGYHYPGFIASSAGRLGYPVLMASPDQLQELRQNPNPFAQFFQRPVQFLQMFFRPQASSNSSKQPEKPEAEKPVVESPVAAKPGTEKPVEAKPNKEKPAVSQEHGSEKPAVSHNHAATATVNKFQEAKQNITATANHPVKKPVTSAPSTPSGQKEKPKDRPKTGAAAVSDVIASINEVVKATSAANAGSAPPPVVVEEADSQARVGDDIRTAEEAAAEADADVNVVPNEESAIDMESKPVA